MAVSETQKETIIQSLKRGNSLRQACRDADVKEPSRVLELTESDSGFAAQYAHARLIGWSIRADDTEEVAADMTIPADHKRIMVDTRKWMLAKMLPKLYGDRLDLQVTRTQADELSTEELQAIVSKGESAPRG